MSMRGSSRVAAMAVAITGAVSRLVPALRGKQEQAPVAPARPPRPAPRRARQSRPVRVEVFLAEPMQGLRQRNLQKTWRKGRNHNRVRAMRRKKARA